MAEEQIRIGYEPGYSGAFTRHHAEGAWENGTRIVKAVSERGDATPNGMLGTVLGSISHPDVGLAYFVEWDNRPKVAVGVIASKLRKDGAREHPAQARQALRDQKSRIKKMTEEEGHNE